MASITGLEFFKLGKVIMKKTGTFFWIENSGVDTASQDY